MFSIALTSLSVLLAAEVGEPVRLPKFQFETVTTTVSVPDGGTILLTGSGAYTNELRSDDEITKLCRLSWASQFHSLCIGGPEVTDNGLAELQNLPELRRLQIAKDMAISAAGLMELQAALPGRRIERR